MPRKVFASPEVQRNTYKEQAYRIIKEAILNHDLEPDRIYAQDDLCESMLISRTPVREALLALQTEGYITFMRGRGVVIPKLSEVQVRAIHEMRYYEEAIAAGLAAERISEKKLRVLEQLVEDMRQEGLTSSEYYRNNRDFHSMIYAASGNYLLQRQLDEVMDWYMFSDPALNKSSGTDWKFPVIEEHARILEALKAHDSKAAGEAMQEHVRLSLERKAPGEETGREERKGA